MDGNTRTPRTVGTTTPYAPVPGAGFDQDGGDQALITAAGPGTSMTADRLLPQPGLGYGAAAAPTADRLLPQPGLGYGPAEAPTADQWLAAMLVRYADLTAFLHRRSIPVLRVALGAVFIWFGALKLTSATPVADLVRHSVPFIQAPAWIVPALGCFEVAIGLCLMFRRALIVILPLFVAHMTATFSVLVTQPGIAFVHGDPLLLTIVGEFVVKNLVLVAAGIAVCTWRPATDTPAPQR
jgi:uncharacterized membrane protein YkgB